MKLFHPSLACNKSIVSSVLCFIFAFFAHFHIERSQRQTVRLVLPFRAIGDSVADQVVWQAQIVPVNRFHKKIEDECAVADYLRLAFEAVQATVAEFRRLVRAIFAIKHSIADS